MKICAMSTPEGPWRRVAAMLNRASDKPSCGVVIIFFVSAGVARRTLFANLFNISTINLSSLYLLTKATALSCCPLRM